MQIEISDHAQLKRRVELPSRLSFRDGNSVKEMDHHLHSEQRDKEPDTVVGGPAGTDAGWLVAQLRHVVIESQDGSREIQRRI